ncbi:DeoR/GlpR family DNA-binding transcription regulator [Alkalihalobacillus sp. CinArs1]|uniref:DeoR/GlpR family DNA-binding transcription regulator n=1 Tax=Alkalihalobacillus sp. CinArs1 TaxID=2995314 RepID=UPI0022DD8A8E|nr:DeoR/GlpR family DNA-binding transcription regulator [Alkalihalobacillus sp. CinArs1]
MSNSPVNRRKQIIDILGQTDYADVTYLSNVFNVSEMTIRRDIDRLEKDNEVIRVYGGVKLKTKRLYEASIEERLKSNHSEKMAIARIAAGLINDGDVIAFDASTTALEVSKLIKDKEKLTVVTNNISIAIELSDTPGIAVILLGGFLRDKSLSLVGPSIKKFLESIYIDKAFFSAKALNFHEGLTDSTIDEGEAKQAMIEKTSQLNVIADRSKLGCVSFFKICGKERIDRIITDELEPYTPKQKECVTSYKTYGTEVVIAK